MTPKTDSCQEVSPIASRTDEVLLRLSETHKPIGVRALARRTSLAPSTVHRILLKLETVGFAKRTGQTGWLLGDKFLLLGMSAWQQNSLPSLADPALFSLEKETGGKVFLGLKMGDSVLLCACAYSHLEALHSSVVGHVFLSTMSAHDLSEYLTRNKLQGPERDQIILSRDRLKNFGWLQSDVNSTKEIYLAAPLCLKGAANPKAVFSLRFNAGTQIEPEHVRAFLDVAKSLKQQQAL